MKPIVVVGSLNADFVISTPKLPREGETILGRDFNLFPGGKGANQSVGIARLGGTVTHVGKVGCDDQAFLLRDSLKQAGVNLAGVIEDRSSHTGVAFIQVADTGANSIVVVPGANMRLLPSDLLPLESLVNGAGIIVLQNEIPLETSLEAARMGKKAGALILYNPAPVQKDSGRLCSIADLVVPNEIELAGMTGLRVGTEAEVRIAAETLLSGHRLSAVIVTLGARGSLIMHPSGSEFLPALPVQVRDTTAAGDAFVAGLAVALSEGKDFGEAARFATVVAGYSVTLLGAQPSLPTRSDLDRFRAQNADSFPPPF